MMQNDGEYLFELIKGEMKEMHIENLEDIYEYAFSHFNAYNKKKLARAIVNEAGLLLILLMMKERTLNDYE